MLIDTHCHFDFDSFDQDRDEVVARAADAGVTRLVVPALDLENCGSVIRLAEQYEGVFAAVGVHPNSLAGWEEHWVEEVRAFAQHEKVVAVGEIGLDYFRLRTPPEIQRQAFEAQLALARELNLPVILHNRESDEDLIEILGSSSVANRLKKGVLHSFSTNWATANAALDLGYHLGFNGPVTYKKADALRSVVARAPINRILIETDAPFLAPQQVRGKRNEPAYVTLVAEQIAKVRGLEYEDLAIRTTNNAIDLFGADLA